MPPTPPTSGPCEAEHLMLISYDRFIETLNTRPHVALRLARQTARLWGILSDLSGERPDPVAQPEKR